MKKLLKSILAVAMVAALLLCCVGCGKPEEEVDPYAGMTDTEYAQALTQNALEEAVDTLIVGYGAYTDLANVAAGNKGVKAELDLTLSDEVIALFEQFVFNTDDSGLDLSFLSNINLDMELDSTDDLAQLQMTLGLSDTKIIALCALLSQDTLWVGAPELNDNYLEFDLEELGVPVASAQPEWMNKVQSIVPSDGKVNEILHRYLAMAVKEIESVERTNHTLELDGLKQDCTKLDIKIYEQDALDAAKAILTAAKDDQDIKKICDDFTTVYNELQKENSDLLDEDAAEIDAYAEFTASVESALEELPEKAETDSYIALTLYVDGKHNIIGSSVSIPALYEEMTEDGESVDVNAAVSTFFYTQYTVTEGDKFNYLFEVKDAGLKIVGSGTPDDDTTTGTYTIYVDDLAYLEVSLKNFKATDDTISGTITLKPSEDILKSITGGTIPYLNIDDVALEVNLDVTKNKENIEIKLIGDDALIVGLALKSSIKESANIEKPTNTVGATGMEPIMNWLNETDFNAVIDNLTDAGVPAILVAALQNVIPAA